MNSLGCGPDGTGGSAAHAVPAAHVAIVTHNADRTRKLDTASPSASPHIGPTKVA
jgi:hypothetical protein